MKNVIKLILGVVLLSGTVAAQSDWQVVYAIPGYSVPALDSYRCLYRFAFETETDRATIVREADQLAAQVNYQGTVTYTLKDHEIDLLPASVKGQVRAIIAGAGIGRHTRVMFSMGFYDTPLTLTLIATTSDGVGGATNNFISMNSLRLESRCDRVCSTTGPVVRIPQSCPGA